MNIIDRSPMKTSTQEALLAQSARRISEAKTPEEKASLVQNFAEQLRVEKLRAKRLQENMKELNNAIMNGGSTSSMAGAPPGRVEDGRHASAAAAISSGPVKLNLMNPNRVGGTSAALFPQEGGNAPSTAPVWTSQYGGQFDLFRNGAGNVNGLGSAINADFQNSPNFGKTGFGSASRRFSDNSSVFPGGSQNFTATNPRASSPSSLTPSSRPLNVNAVPFVMQPKTAPRTSNAPIFNQPKSSGADSVKEVLIRRMTASPPLVSPVAVAPKSSALDMGRQSRDLVSVPEGRPRSASIGAQQKLNVQHRLPISNQVESPMIGGIGRGIVQQNQATPPFGRAPFAQLSKDSDLPKSQQPEGSLKVKPPMGSVKIDISGKGQSLLAREDWDVEYSESAQKQQPKKSSPILEKPAEVVIATEKKKDWLAVLKERDDMAKCRYSREVMLRLYESEPSKIRPANLSPEYNNDVGLWSPDLWFFVNFQKDQPQSQPPMNKNPSTFGRGGTGSGTQDSQTGLRRITCLSSIHSQKE